MKVKSRIITCSICFIVTIVWAANSTTFFTKKIVTVIIDSLDRSEIVILYSNRIMIRGDIVNTGEGIRPHVTGKVSRINNKNQIRISKDEMLRVNGVIEAVQSTPHITTSKDLGTSGTLSRLRIEVSNTVCFYGPDVYGKDKTLEDLLSTLAVLWEQYGGIESE